MPDANLAFYQFCQNYLTVFDYPKIKGTASTSISI